MTTTTNQTLARDALRFFGRFVLLPLGVFVAASVALVAFGANDLVAMFLGGAMAAQAVMLQLRG